MVRAHMGDERSGKSKWETWALVEAHAWTVLQSHLKIGVGGRVDRIGRSDEVARLSGGNFSPDS